jgi:ectoine hydroxylase-related dioxygenase (phytanoyl-CoA dioxygenase family)
MRVELTPAEVASYRDRGFVVIEDFLDAAELEEWRQVTDQAVEQRLGVNTPEGWHRLHNQGDPDDFYAQVFTQCLRLADTHPRMRELVYDRRIGRLGARLAGVAGLRVWHDQALYKPPFGNPTAWHLDNPFWSFSSRDALSIWIALDDATLGNGCLWYIPGSQRTARFENSGIGPEQQALFKLYPEWRTIEPVPGPCRAGAAVWHNGLTAHGAGANMTNRPRRAMTCAFMPDGSTFNGQQNILSSEQMARLKIGDVLNDERQNPLVWHQDWER